MRVYIFLLLLVGVFLTIHGIYEEKIHDIKKQVKIVYKYVPRDSFDQMVIDSRTPKYSYMFD